MAQSKRKPTEAQYRKAYEEALHTYGHRVTVTGIDLGNKYAAGKRTDVKSVRFHVQEKFALEALEAAEIFPDEIGGVPTDVVRADYAVSQLLDDLRARVQRLTTIQPGISIGHTSITAGTLGAVVYDEISSQPGILSNWHVLAGSPSAAPGDAIVQPGPRDGGRAARDTIATLERSVLGADGDAAFALLTGARSVREEQFTTGQVIRSARPVVEDDVLEKSGRTTGVTRARVDGIGRYFLDYRGMGRVGVDGFKLVPELDGNPDDEEISMGGDSGSVWYDPNTLEGVGLHFGGEQDTDPRAENALACHLPQVLSVLGISLAPVEVAMPIMVAHTAGTPAALPVPYMPAPANGSIRISSSNGGTGIGITVRIEVHPAELAAG